MEPVDRLPFWPKLDAAYPAAQASPFRGMALDALHAWIGSDRHEGIPGCLREVRSRTACEVLQRDNMRRTVFRTPRGERQLVCAFDAPSNAWHPVAFPVRTVEDVLFMTEAFDDVTVEFAGQARSATAGPDGRWRVALSALDACTEPRPMTIACGGPGGSRRVIQNVLVGDVWVCSGQSNMEWPLASSDGGREDVAAARHPGIRLFTVPRKADVHPAADAGGTWDVCSPDSVGAFSGVGYHFGREIHRRTGVPVGLINTSWGGTIAEAWTSRDGLARNAYFRRVVRQYEYELKHPDKTQREARAAMRRWARQSEMKDTSNVGQARGWHLPDADTAGWETMELPGNWQGRGHNYSGVFWFRLDVDVPAAWAGKDLTLSLGALDKSDVSYFNGARVGSLTMEQRPDAWCTPRVYRVPARLVRTGRNVIAVRVFSNIYQGGFIGVPSQMRLFPADDPDAGHVPLAGAWKYSIEANFGLVPPPPPQPRGPGNPNSPYMLFENMIRPLLPFAIRGAVWYQGESNAGQAHDYRTLLPLMIRDWRRHWKCGPFPFYIVQLANYLEPAREPGECAWAELRDAQLFASRSVPNSGLAVTIDIGDAKDVHPRNKRDVGLRLAFQALRKTYGMRSVACDGPVLRGMTVRGRRCVLRFDTGGQPLAALDGKPLRGFAVAGIGSKFVWAQATIEGRTVVVWSDDVAKPAAVRYGWSDNPDSNLGLANGLPASPFRTDRRPYSTRRA
jgi:sialate O-acetylesterase